MLNQPKLNNEPHATLTQTAPAVTNPTAYAEFKEIFDHYFPAWGPGTSKLNIDVPAQFYAQEPNQVFYDIIPPLQGYAGLEEYMANIQKNFYDNFSSFYLTPNYNDLRVTRRSDVAWTTITFHASGTQNDGKPLEADGRLTHIWERRDGKWLIVHEHCSVPLPG